MKELISLILKLDFKALFVDKTDNGMIGFFRYCFVGGIAFLVDYAAFAIVCFLAGSHGIVTALATVAGFVCGLTVNYLLSKKFVFVKEAKCKSATGEFIAYAIIGIVGCGLDVLIMMFFTDWCFDFNRYIVKIFAALIVLVYNYTARKFILYSK